MKREKICGTIAAIRNAFPFAAVNARPVIQPVPVLKDVNDAVKHYQRPKDFFTAEHYLRSYDRADYQGAPNQIRLFTWRFMRALRARGLPFYVHTCWRDPLTQQILKDKGNSNLSSGPHQRSAAVDIVSAIDHWEIPDPVWYYVGTLGESVARGMHFGKGLDGQPLKIEWGGRWDDPFDPAHWQLSDWKYRPVVDPYEPLRLSPYSDRMRF